jgi:hypothetical protein
VFVCRVTAVPVFPANDLAASLFDGANETRDNLDQLRGYIHIRRMRWVRPENVEVMS